MTDFGLLAKIVSDRGIQPEPVATDALVQLLGSSSAARRVITDMAKVACPDLDLSDASYLGQAIGDLALARPDIVGIDSSGRRLIVEAKFDLP